LHDAWLSPGLLHYIYTFLGLLVASDGISPRANFTLCPSLAFSYIGSVTARHSSSGVSRQTLRRGTRNGITAPSQRAPPIFGWAAITRLNDVHTSGYNSARSEQMWMKFGMLRVYCPELALTDFGRDPRRSESGRASGIFFGLVSNNARLCPMLAS